MSRSSRRHSSVVQSLAEEGRIQPPKWLPNAVAYETLMGSVAYGVSSDTSDSDIYGFCIPPKEQVFPHLAGEIPGFGRQINRFEQYQQHHIPGGPDEPNKQYDVTVFGLVKFFHLAMENNPNIIDSLFTPVNCVLHSTPIGQHVRENRRLFLHKGAWHKFKGYSYSQLHKMEIKAPQEGSRRAELVEQHGFDVKFAYHTVRLLDEVEQILAEGDIDLQRNREQLKAIRRGEWTAEQVKDHFNRKERDLEELYQKSALPHSPDETRIKALLLECLEMHFGSLSAAVTVPERDRELLRQIKALCEKAGV
jgi:Predicted nucleotidyltransferase